MHGLRLMHAVSSRETKVVVRDSIPSKLVDSDSSTLLRIGSYRIANRFFIRLLSHNLRCVVIAPNSIIWSRFPGLQFKEHGRKHGNH